MARARSPSPLLMPLAAAALALTLAEGCVFDCTGKIGTLCGGNVSYAPRVFSHPVAQADGTFAPVATAPLHALNLTRRNITAVAPGGLSCYFSADPPGGGDDDDEAYAPGATQAVLLDSNPLLALPRFDVFAGVSHVSMRNTTVATVPDSAFASLRDGYLFVDLSGSAVSSVAPGAFAGYSGHGLMVDLSFNRLTGLSNGTVRAYAGRGLFLDLTGNGLTEWPAGALAGYGGHGLTLDLSGNPISSVPAGALTSFGGQELSLDLSGCPVASWASGALRGFAGASLSVDVTGGRLASLPDGALSGFSGQSLAVAASANRIGSLGAVFEGCAAAASCYLGLAGNSVTQTSIVAALGSYTSSPGALTVDASGNNVTAVPPRLFAGVGSAVSGYVDVTVDLAGNPVASVSLDMGRPPHSSSDDDDDDDDGYGAPWHARLGSVTINASHTTAGAVRLQQAAATTWGFSGVRWSPATGGSLNVSLVGTSVDVGVVDAVSADAGNAPRALALDLAGNGYAVVGAGAFSRPLATWLGLAGNSITSVSPDAFNFTTRLQGLDLSNNRLSVIPAGLLANTPALAALDIASNGVWALPAADNHIAAASAAASNPLSCAAYGPAAADCSCSASTGATLSVWCGYVRCTPTRTGCGASDLWNSTDCSAAPQSSCVAVANAPQGQYYNPATSSFAPLTECSAAYGGAPSYQYRAATVTSDRVCSACAVCSPGLAVEAPCTATSDTRCVAASPAPNSTTPAGRTTTTAAAAVSPKARPIDALKDGTVVGIVIGCAAGIGMCAFFAGAWATRRTLRGRGPRGFSANLNYDVGSTADRLAFDREFRDGGAHSDDDDDEMADLALLGSL